MKLYELSDEYRRLLDDYNTAETQEEMDAIAERLDAVSVAWEDKARACLIVRSEAIASASAIAAEIKRLTALRDAAETRAERMRRYVETQMLATDRDRADLGVYKVRLQDSPPSVTWFDVDALPDEYVRVVPAKREPDKRAIVEAWSSGIEVPGAEVQQKRGIRIQ